MKKPKWVEKEGGGKKYIQTRTIFQKSVQSMDSDTQKTLNINFSVFVST